MEITIGIQNLPRELVLDVDSNAADISDKLNKAMESGGLLELTDTRGRAVIVPASAIGYLEIGPEEIRKVGFGSL